MKQWLSDLADSRLFKKIAYGSSYSDAVYKRTIGELPTVESVIEDFALRTGLTSNPEHQKRHSERRANVKIAVKKLTLEQYKDHFKQEVIKLLRSNGPLDYVENVIFTRIFNENNLTSEQKQQLVKHLKPFMKERKEFEDQRKKEPMMYDNYDPFDSAGIIQNERKFNTANERPLSLRHIFAKEREGDFLIETTTTVGKTRGRYGTIDRRAWEGRPLLEYMEAAKRLQRKQGENFCLDTNKKLNDLRKEYPETIDPVLREMAYGLQVKDLRGDMQLNDAQPNFYTVRCMYPGCGMSFGATSPNGPYIKGQHLADHYVHAFTEKGQSKYSPVSQSYEPGEKIQKLDAERLEAHYDGKPIVDSDSYGYMLSRYPREFEMRYMLSHPLTVSDNDGGSKREWEKMWLFPNEITSLKLNDKDLQEAIEKIAQYNPKGGGLNLSLDLVEDPEMMASFLPQIKEELGIEPEETTYDVNIRDMLTALHQILYEQWKEHIGKGYIPNLEEWRKITKQYKRRPQMSKVWKQTSKARALFEDSIIDKDPRWYNRMQYDKLKCERCDFTLGIMTTKDKKDLASLKQRQRELIGVMNPSSKEKRELQDTQEKIVFYQKKEQPIIFKSAAERNSWVCPNCDKPIILHIPFKCPIDKQIMTTITVADEKLKYGKTSYPAECKDCKAKGMVYVDRVMDPEKKKAASPPELAPSLMEEVSKPTEKLEIITEEPKKPLSREQKRSQEMREMFDEEQ